VFMQLIRSLDSSRAGRTFGHYERLKDDNEAIAFLRASVINLLVNKATEIFLDHRTEILAGSFNETLLGMIDQQYGAMKEVEEISISRIYGHDTVIQIELAGFNVMSELLQQFVPALLKASPSHREEKVLRLIPFQYTGFRDTDSAYEKVLNALDHLSGMTDEYATEMYRRLKGISIPGHG
jgi:dGTPase